MAYYAKCGDLTGAVQSLYSNGVCPLSNEIKTQLINIHPDEYKLDPDDAKKVLMKTKVTKAPGVDGWKPYYLRAIIGHHNEDRLLAKLVSIWRNIIDGRLPQQMAKIWTTSKGTPLAKNKQKTKARPLASGICLRLCLTAVFVSHYIRKINDIIFPLNIGDARNGTELMAFTLRTMISHDEMNCKLDGCTP